MNWRNIVLFTPFAIMVTLFVLVKFRVIELKIAGRSYGSWRARDGALVGIGIQLVMLLIYILLFVVFKPHE